MPDAPQTINGLRAITVRLTIPWRGVWVAHVEVDADLPDAVVMTGPAVLVAGNTILSGTIDPRGTGRFNDRIHMRVVGGRGGWDKEVPAQHFTNPAGALVSTLVYAATAATVLETCVDPTPVVFGEHFVRSRGAASRVFGDRDWRVDLVTGITTTAPWPPLPLDPTATVADFHIETQTITVNSETVILPGSVIVDERFKGKTFIARDVEQIFDTKGTTATIWVAEKPVSRLAEAFATAVREYARTEYLKTYLYRFVVPAAGGKIALQAITPGAPDLNPIDQWTGLSGIQAALAGNAQLKPATEIVVGFVGGDPTAPYLVAFSPLAKPLGITIDALTFVDVGVPTSFVALATLVDANFTAMQTWLTAHVHPTGVGPSGPSPGVPAPVPTGSIKLRSE